jgi:hypothetical protein
MGAVLQQLINNAWKPLTFSKKLNPAQQKRHFTIFTDHKPITYAFQQKRDKCSRRQFNHLDFVAQYTKHIRHISGQGKVVADALSRVEFVTGPPSYDALAA